MHYRWGKGVYELKIDYGPGYRIYYGLEGKTVVLLLWGGDKASQRRDIAMAKRYWINNTRRKRNGYKSDHLPERPH